MSGAAPRSRTFPIINQHREMARKLGVSVPWGLVAPHERQAMVNHDQTLERLAERGGLSACELLAVLEDRRWRWLPAYVALNRIKVLVDQAGKV